MAGPARPASTPLEAALLDFQRAPGRHAVARREPIALFAAIREVLQLAAAGRLADSAAPPDAALQVAALMFIRSALFQPSADHYVLLGLDRSAEPAAVKERYRQVMRVIHPDFAAGGESRWPTDAASRVNNAYEVLSDPDRRLAYDEALAGGAAAASASVASSAATPAPPRAARRSVHTARVARADPPDRRNTLKWAVAGSGAAAAAVLLTSVLLGGRQDEVHLVQRQTAPVAAARPSAPASAPAALAVAAVVPAEVPKTATAPPPPAPVQLAAAVLKLQASLSLVPVPAQPVPARSVGPDQPRAAGVPTAPSVEPPRSAPAAEAVAAQVAATPAPAPVSPPAMVAAPALAPTHPPSAAMARAAPAPAAPPALPAAEQAAALVPRPLPAPAAGPAQRPTPSLAEAQPLLTALLQYLESGRGERVLSLLDREGRNSPGAQALSRHYEDLVEGARPVRLSQVEFRAEPLDGRLLVTGQVRLHTESQPAGATGKKLMLRAEFAHRAGSVVMTGLSGVGGN